MAEINISDYDLHLYKYSFDTTKQFIAILDDNMNIRKANKAFLDLMHKEEIDIYNTPYWELPLWEHSADVQNLIMFSIENMYLGGDVKFETTYSTKDDEVRYAEFMIKPKFDENGEIEVLIAMGYDVTDIKLAERKLKRTEKELETFFDSGIDGYLIRRLEKPVKLEYSNMNKMFETIFPNEVASKFNKSLVKLLQITPDLYNGFDLFNNENLYTKKEELEEYFEEFITRGHVKFEKNFVLNDGTKRYLEITSVAIINNHYYSGGFYLVKDVTYSREYEEKLFNLANFDMLTSLTNRRYFMFQIEQIMNSEDFVEGSVCMFDIDNFKIINDKFGHDIGDLVLAHISKTMNGVIENRGILARMGGEEFCAFLSSDLDGAVDIIDELFDAIRKSEFILDSHLFSLKLTISAGIASVKKNDTIDKFLKKSDSALYEAKNSGRDRYCIFKGDL